MRSSTDRRNIAVGPRNGGATVKGDTQRVRSPDQSQNDPLEDDVQAFLIDEDQLHTFDDLTKVNPVTPATVLKCLQARYNSKVFYTHAGCTLVALNPFQPIPDLYSVEVMKEYHCATQPQEFKPHIFIVAEEAYRNIQGQLEPVNQSLVVSGESGAGKTWTSRCLMKYYATVAASAQAVSSQDAVERIERRVLDSNPLMEAFGNACTLRNSNSSRFGKYIQLQMNRTQLLVGASVQTYLLEKTRVACQPANERNFHIFYQMMKGATDEQRTDWKMPHDQCFVWLPNCEKQIEEDGFLETTEAMVHLGIDAERQRQIFRILAGILQLGNVSFCSSTNESQPCDLHQDSEDFLQRAGELLGVPAEELCRCLRVRTLKAGKQNVLKPCSQAECGVRRDCLAKVIYGQLFEWLVTFINSCICADQSKWCNFIGVLDVHGFECFHINNLEQLCINYANEKLQQHFVAHYLRAQQEEYVSEGLEWSFIKYQDNQSCLDLLEGSPVSVFSLLNEESRLNRASDSTALRGRLEKELGGNDNICWDKFSTVPHFTVTHYAGKVRYQLEGMVEKNKDPVPPELIGLLQKSDNLLLREIFSDKETEIPHSKGLGRVTVISKFKNSLENLMKLLLTTAPHYTRCIKPNSDCRPLTFKNREVISQLEACGIVETIHISAAGFPIRIPLKSFVQRYGPIGKCSTSSPLDADPDADGADVLQQEVEKLLRVALQHNVSCDGRRSLVHCGKTRVFLTQPMLDLLEDRRGKMLSRCAFTIQCCWLRHQRRRRLARRQSATLIQAAVRSWLVRKQIRRWNGAASVIQNTWKKWRALLKSLAEAELDDAADLAADDSPALSAVVRQRGSVQLSSFQEPVPVRGWPMGLALASAPSITVSLTATGFQKMISVMTSLNLPSRRGEYKVETNQYKQGLASIRARPRGSVKLHYQRSPLLYADMQPDLKSNVTGFNEILLEKTL
ncbi:unconventional myosin-XIX isoform X1 [Gambusia affinis]|uniref:unconventional myosin-XIX isoform X1 n=1 Tax=Gambusia affinis TaxID=33528 RepID=UPI001CDBA1B4|nr:unconventional myosin-XIX isoform X1 [Gambusia affinis]XP_043997317.1 unconventional myosin-XIX isoform X1 [Gambusia affinis]